MTTGTLTTIEHHIAGALTPGDSTRRSPVWEPAGGVRQAEVLLAEPSDVDRAAQAASASWSEVSLARRARIMFAFRELVHTNSASLRRAH